MKKTYDHLRPYATPLQLAAIDALETCGTIRKAAACLGVSKSAVMARLQQAERSAARSGVSPAHDLTRPVAPGYHARGHSTLYRRGEEEPVLQWVKTQIDADQQIEALLQAVRGAVESIPAVEPVPAPAFHRDDYLAVIPMGDPHVGMYSWARETGADFDLEIAESVLYGSIDHLVSLMPEGIDALLLNLGDFFHADDQSNTTRKSGHQLDVDSRWPKVLEVGIRIMHRAIDRMLQRCRTVRVRNEIGNHDSHTSLVLAYAQRERYRNEPRVVVETSPAKFWYLEFGQCLIGSTHLDTVKPPALPGIMAVDQREAWGRTLHRRWYTGHEHHERVKEYPGCVVETFRTTAASDAWHSAHGYRSERDMRLDLWHRDHGIVNRHIVGVGQLGVPS